MKLLTTLLVVALIAVVGCADFGILTPATGAGTPYPCGIDGVTCGGDPVMCCPSDSVCCTGATCPKQTCDYLGSDDDHDHLGASRKRRNVPQTPAQP